MTAALAEARFASRVAALSFESDDFVLVGVAPLESAAFVDSADPDCVFFVAGVVVVFGVVVGELVVVVGLVVVVAVLVFVGVVVVVVVVGVLVVGDGVVPAPGGEPSFSLGAAEAACA